MDLEHLLEHLHEYATDLLNEDKDPLLVDVKISITNKSTKVIVSDISAIYYDTNCDRNTLLIECLVDNVSTFYSNIL